MTGPVELADHHQSWDGVTRHPGQTPRRYFRPGPLVYLTGEGWGWIPKIGD
jgi:hypothetical protein